MLNIQAELVDTGTESQLWGEQFRQKTSDLLIVQEEIAWQISEALRLKLTGEQKKKLRKRPTGEPRGLSGVSPRPVSLEQLLSQESLRVRASTSSERSSSIRHTRLRMRDSATRWARWPITDSSRRRKHSPAPPPRRGARLSWTRDWPTLM